MLTHVVLFRFHPDASDERREAVFDALRSLPGAIPSVRSYRVARDLGLNPANAHFSIVATFDDQDGFLTYRDHPEHQRFIREHITPDVIEHRLGTQLDAGTVVFEVS